MDRLGALSFFPCFGLIMGREWPGPNEMDDFLPGYLFFMAFWFDFFFRYRAERFHRTARLVQEFKAPRRGMIHGHPRAPTGGGFRATIVCRVGVYVSKTLYRRYTAGRKSLWIWCPPVFIAAAVLVMFTLFFKEDVIQRRAVPKRGIRRRKIMTIFTTHLHVFYAMNRLLGIGFIGAFSTQNPFPRPAKKPGGIPLFSVYSRRAKPAVEKKSAARPTKWATLGKWRWGRSPSPSGSRHLFVSP